MTPLLCFVLGPMFEKSFIQSMAMSSGSFAIFFQRPISLTIIILALLLFIFSLFIIRRTKRQVKAVVGEDLELAD